MKIISLQNVILADNPIATASSSFRVMVGGYYPSSGSKVISIDYHRANIVVDLIDVDGVAEFPTYRVKTKKGNIFILPADKYIAEWVEDGDQNEN